MTGLQLQEAAVIGTPTRKQCTPSRGLPKGRRQRQSSMSSSSSLSSPSSSPRDSVDGRESEDDVMSDSGRQGLEEPSTVTGRRLRNAIFQGWATSNSTTADSTHSSSCSDDDTSLQGRSAGYTDTNNHIDRRKVKAEAPAKRRSTSIALNSSANNKVTTRSPRRSSMVSPPVCKDSASSAVKDIPTGDHGKPSAVRTTQRWESLRRASLGMESLRGSPKGSSSRLQGLPPLPSIVGLVLFRKLYLARLEKETLNSSSMRRGDCRGSLEAVNAIETVCSAQNSHNKYHRDILSAEELGELPKEPRFSSTLSSAAQLAMLQGYEEKLQATTCYSAETDMERQMELVEATLEELLSGEEGEDHTQVERQLQASRLFEKAMRLLDDAREAEEQDGFDEDMFQLTRTTMKAHRVSFKLD